MHLFTAGLGAVYMKMMIVIHATLIVSWRFHSVTYSIEYEYMRDM